MERKETPIGRIALHASSLEFLHPETDDPVRFEATIPFGPENEKQGLKNP